MKASPATSADMTWIYGLFGALASWWRSQWDGTAIRAWLEECVVLLGEAQIELGGPFELLGSQEFDPAQLEDADLPE